MTETKTRVGIKDHEGNKYVRRIRSCVEPGEFVEVDVYSVLVAFGVTDPAVAHAAKKVLCAGIRGKGSAVDDFQGAIAALHRAIELASDPMATSSRDVCRGVEVSSAPVEVVGYKIKGYRVMEAPEGADLDVGVGTPACAQGLEVKANVLEAPPDHFLLTEAEGLLSAVTGTQGTVWDSALRCWRAGMAKRKPGVDHAAVSKRRLDLLEAAWGVIANAGAGDWETQSAEWQTAAAQFREEFHSELRDERGQSLSPLGVAAKKLDREAFKSVAAGIKQERERSGDVHAEAYEGLWNELRLEVVSLWREVTGAGAGAIPAPIPALEEIRDWVQGIRGEGGVLFKCAEIVRKSMPTPAALDAAEQQIRALGGDVMRIQPLGTYPRTRPAASSEQPVRGGMGVRCGRCLMFVPATTFMHDCAGESLAPSHYVKRLEDQLEKLGRGLSKLGVEPEGGEDGVAAALRVLAGRTAVIDPGGRKSDKEEVTHA